MKSGGVGSKTNEASDILPKLSTNDGMSSASRFMGFALLSVAVPRDPRSAGRSKIIISVRS
jgi:hypothetical protein